MQVDSLDPSGKRGRAERQIHLNQGDGVFDSFFESLGRSFAD